MAEESHSMSTATVMSSFEEIEPAAAALERLRGLGLSDGDISILSSLPFSAKILGRPHPKTRLPLISMGSALLGLGAGLFLVVVSPFLYIIRVGGQPIVPIPPTALLLYEFIMLALILGTFIGFLVLNRFPSARPHYYDPKLTDGRISLVVHSPADQESDVVAIMQEYAAQVVQDPQRRRL